MLNYLNSGTDGFLTRLAGINITDLMLAVSIVGTRGQGRGSACREILNHPGARSAILSASDRTKLRIKPLKNYAVIQFSRGVAVRMATSRHLYPEDS